MRFCLVITYNISAGTGSSLSLYRPVRMLCDAAMSRTVRKISSLWQSIGRERLSVFVPVILLQVDIGTKLLIGEQLSAYTSVRRDEVVLSRLRLGQSYLTHSYLLKWEPPPECVTCNCRLTISHILVDCIEYDFFRWILFENNFTLTDIFNNVSPNKIISFIKRAGLYNTL